MRPSCMLEAGPGSLIVVIDDNRKFVIAARSTPLDAPCTALMTAKGALFGLFVLELPGGRVCRKFRQASVWFLLWVVDVGRMGDVRFEARGRW